MPVVFADLSAKAESDQAHENLRRVVRLPSHLYSHFTYTRNSFFRIYENENSQPVGQISADFTTINLYHGESPTEWIMRFAREIETALDIQVIIHTYMD